jgi:DNA polymerase-3 subunit alpha
MARRGTEDSGLDAQVSTFKRDCDHDAYQPIGVRARRRQRAAARRHGGLKPMRFVSLHHHSTYSYLDGFQLPEAHVRRATEINMGAIAMTEHGNIFSHVKLEMAAEKQGVKPIFGCEIYCSNAQTQKKNHLTLLAMNDEGYKNLMQLVSKSWADGFYHEPTVNYQWLKEYSKGIICLSGCLGSALTTALVGGKFVDPADASYARGKKVARFFKKIFGDRFFLEVQAFPELELTRKANPLIERLGRDLGIRLVATMDCHYTAPEEQEIQKLLHNVRPGEKRTLEDMVRDWGYEVPLCPPPTDMAIFRRLRSSGLSKAAALESIISTEEIAQACTVTLPKLPSVEYPLPRGFKSPKELWRAWLKEGWLYRKCDKLPARERARYKKQLLKETKVIEAKGYESYFLVVADAVKFAKNEQIPVGPARGSAAASLACWLLRITEVNPMLFDNLVFERFIDWSREDMPDIDLDFATYGRPVIRDYLVGKYGEGCVSNVGTFTVYKSKLALDDVARVHRIPKFKVETVKNLLIERSSGDLRASATIEDTVGQFEDAAEVIEEHPELRYAMDLEGNVKGFGVHAAGLVVSNGPITDVTAVIEKDVKGHLVQVVSMDKKDAERQGLEKLDFLALGTMDMIADALQRLDMKVEELYELPLDDEVTIEGFRQNDVLGIFQFEGRAMRSINGALHPDNFDEICDVTALARPGPLHNGAANAYIDIKRGAMDPPIIHPALSAITASTNHQIVYQEQILKTVVQIGQFDWTSAAYIRKIISKKLGEQEFNRQWSKFWDGARTLHERSDYPPMEEGTAKQIWGELITSGSYAFNAAHSRSYGMIGFWCMWFKQHHPEVFFASSLSKTRRGGGGGNVKSAFKNNQIDRHTVLMRDAKKGKPECGREPIDVLPPTYESGVQWEYAESMLVAGMVQIPGVGEKTAEAMDEYRQTHKVTGWQDYVAVSGIGPKTMEKIEEFVEQDDPFNIEGIDRTLDSVRDMLIEGWGGLPVPTHTASEVPYERGKDTKVVFLGMPLDINLRDIYESNRARTGEELDRSTVRDPDLNEFAVVLCNDGDEQVFVRLTRWQYPKFKKMLWGTQLGHDLLLVEGVKKGYRTAREVEVRKMWVIDPDEED